MARSLFANMCTSITLFVTVNQIKVNTLPVHAVCVISLSVWHRLIVK